MIIIIVLFYSIKIIAVDFVILYYFINTDTTAVTIIVDTITITHVIIVIVVHDI